MSCRRSFQSKATMLAIATVFVLSTTITQTRADEAASNCASQATSQPATPATSPAASYVVQSSEPLPWLTDKFRPSSQTSRERWSGSDAAYSIPLGADRTLWMFGDTYICQHSNRKVAETELTMINNSAAIQRLDAPTAPLTFFWQHHHSRNRSLVQAKSKGTWLWPLDGIAINNRLYEIVNVLKRAPNGDKGFEFEAVGQSLLRVSNVQSPPDKWRCSLMPLTAVPTITQGTHTDSSRLQFGNAVFADKKYLYLFSSCLTAQKGLNKHPLLVARIALDELEAKKTKKSLSSCLEFWSSAQGENEARLGKWTTSPDHPIILFQDGAPELTISPVQGMDGLFATYFPAGFGGDIMLRHADRPEGPWSEPICAYHCPEDLKHYFVYSAKAHPELATKEGELVVTYCVNEKSRDPGSKTVAAPPPSYYFPHAIRLQLQKY